MTNEMLMAIPNGWTVLQSEPYWDPRDEVTTRHVKVKNEENRVLAITMDNLEYMADPTSVGAKITAFLEKERESNDEV